MKTPDRFSAKIVLAQLAALAPSVSFETLWEHDQDAKWDVDDPSLDPLDYQAWQSDVCAKVIVNGKLCEGHAYLGGSWLEFGDDPAETYADIGGYLLQMLEEATKDLCDSLSRAGGYDGPLLNELAQARAYLRQTLVDRYNESEARA